MPFYYLSFCDPALPKGTQFLGATVVEAPHMHAIPAVAHMLGRNPGGEIAIVELEGLASRDEAPEIGRKYFDRFIPRDEVLADEAEQDGDFEESDDEDMRQAVICPCCNGKAH
jgi:hypothetical protein